MSSDSPASGTQDSKKLQNPVLQPQTVFAPCVVHNIHEVAAYSAAGHGTEPYTRDDIADNKVVITHVQDGDQTSETAKKKRSACSNCLSRASSAVTWGLETGFFRIGLFVGEYPIVTIITLLIMCGLCGIGMKTFEETEEQEKLWVPQSSRIIPEKAWVDQTFPQETRYVTYMIVQPQGNILTRDSILAMLDYYNISQNIEVHGRKLQDMCVKVGPFCYVSSLLEIWRYNETRIMFLSSDDIIDSLNTTVVSPVSGLDVKTLLGGDVMYDDQGRIISAEATQMTWVLEKNEDNSDAADWEKEMIDLALKGKPSKFSTYVYATRSFDDEGYGAINSDINLLTAGFSVVFVFIMLALGKFNLIEQKIYLSLCGMGCIGLSILVAYGLATAMGVMYSPIQTIMPFLLLGIGVDDMFVIVETWKNLSPEEAKLPTPQKIAMTLSRAGVSITVTSVTDIVAFGIGATTVIPALSGFCIYAALGILALFVLVATVFAAVLALDDRRLKANRDACLCCYKHPDTYTPNRCSTGESFMSRFMGSIYGPLVTKLPVQIFIILVSIALAGLGLWRFIQMKEDFDLINYIPSDSYAYSFARTKENYFDREGIDTSIYCGGFDYFAERHHLQKMHDEISKSPYIQQGTVNSWFAAFSSWTIASGKNVTNKEDYYSQLYQFLYSPMGQRFASFVKFNSSVEPVSITASYFTMTHTRQSNSQGETEAMDALRLIIDSAGFPKFSGEDMPEYMCMAFTTEYLSLETTKVLAEELYRNLALASAAVFIVTLVLIANLWTCLMVLVCILFTVVDVGGILEVWGTTIDTACSVLLTLAVGLAVDYSAHIGHTFMTIKGTRKNRVIMTLKTIGPAVFNGGFSTFLAFVMLVKSASYGFQLFFRVFLSVVVFGLFHGLALLPVLLGLMGPAPYDHSDEIPANIAMEVDKKIMENHTQDVTSNHILKNGNHNEFSKHAYNGPIGVLYHKPDDVELSPRRQRSQLPTIEEDASKKPYVSVIDVIKMDSHHTSQQPHNDKWRPAKHEEGLTKF